MYLHAKLELGFPFSNWQDLSHPNSHLRAILVAARASHPHNWLPQVDIKLIARGTHNIENRDVVRRNFRWCCCMHDSSTGDSNSTESLASFSSVTDTPPRFLMESIRSPDTPDKLLMDSWWTPDRLLMDSWWTPGGLLIQFLESIRSLYTLPKVHQESYQDFVDLFFLQDCKAVSSLQLNQ